MRSNHRPHLHWWVTLADGTFKCILAGCGAHTEERPEGAWSA